MKHHLSAGDPPGDEDESPGLFERELALKITILNDIVGQRTQGTPGAGSADSARNVLAATALVLAMGFGNDVQALVADCYRLYAFVTGIDDEEDDLEHSWRLAAAARGAVDPSGEILDDLIDPSAAEILTVRELLGVLRSLATAHDGHTPGERTPKVDGEIERLLIVLGLRYPSPVQLLLSDVLSLARTVLGP